MDPVWIISAIAIIIVIVIAWRVSQRHGPGDMDEN
jgi:hypothetical protein